MCPAQQGAATMVLSGDGRVVSIEVGDVNLAGRPGIILKAIFVRAYVAAGQRSQSSETCAPAAGDPVSLRSKSILADVVGGPAQIAVVASTVRYGPNQIGEGGRTNNRTAGPARLRRWTRSSRPKWAWCCRFDGYAVQSPAHPGCCADCQNKEHQAKFCSCQSLVLFICKVKSDEK